MSTRKRSASGMASPDQLPATKKPKLKTALEASLTKLQETLGIDELPPSWEFYDPNCFMAEMRRLSGEIN